jgi:hypothetical protein
MALSERASRRTVSSSALVVHARVPSRLKTTQIGNGPVATAASSFIVSMFTNCTVPGISCVVPSRPT